MLCCSAAGSFSPLKDRSCTIVQGANLRPISKKHGEAKLARFCSVRRWAWAGLLKEGPSSSAILDGRVIACLVHAVQHGAKVLQEAGAIETSHTSFRMQKVKGFKAEASQRAAG